MVSLCQLIPRWTVGSYKITLRNPGHTARIYMKLVQHVWSLHGPVPGASAGKSGNTSVTRPALDRGVAGACIFAMFLRNFRKSNTMLHHVELSRRGCTARDTWQSCGRTDRAYHDQTRGRPPRLFATSCRSVASFDGVAARPVTHH